MAVAVVGKTTSGAKLSLVIGKFVFQPSEFVKITFVFFVAAMLSKSTEFADIVRTTILAAAMCWCWQCPATWAGHCCSL